MKMRRGFRVEAEGYAAEFRQELGLEVAGPLCPFRLAALLRLPVVPLSDLPGFATDSQTAQWDAGGFSAVTIPGGTYKMIVHNDGHHPVRQNSNVMHEISHILLGHPPHPPFTGDGCRNFQSLLEKEAKELAFTLLVPRPAALAIVESGAPLAIASAGYGVSRQLLDYRIRITDARRWAMNRQRLSTRNQRA